MDYVPTQDDIIWLELNNTLGDLEAFVLQAKKDATKFTPYYYNLIIKLTDAACELSNLVANAEMPNIQAIKQAGL